MDHISLEVFPFSFEKLAYERVLFASEHKGGATHQFIYFKNPIILVQEAPIPSKLAIKCPEWCLPLVFPPPRTISCYYCRISSPKYKAFFMAWRSDSCGYLFFTF